MEPRKTILYIASSLDGYIAKPGENLDFLKLVEMEGEDYGYVEFSKTIDTIIMGRKTYDWVVKEVGHYPHEDVQSYIITRKERPSEGNVQFYSGDLRILLDKLRSQPGKDIFLDGGAELMNELMHLDLIDEYIISVIPVLLGDGIRLFKDGRPEQGIRLLGTVSYGTGLVQLHYKRERP